MSYEDFIIQIAPNGADGYAARVVSSPDGEAVAPFEPPFTARGPGGLAWNGDDTSIRNVSPMSGGAAPRSFPDPRDWGARLFDALFRGVVRSRFDRSLGKVEGRPGGGLRIKLKLDYTEPAIAGLSRLPWEWMYQTERGLFLGLSRRTPLVRYLDVPGSSDQEPLPPTLRILAVHSRPRGAVELDLDRELRYLTEVWDGAPVQVDLLGSAALRELRRRLLRAADRGRPFHVLHFMGHGRFDPGRGEGELVFEGERRAEVAVSGRHLAHQLRGLRSLRLVFLNACETGRPGAHFNPFAGVASALVQGGIPAVVAMQEPIPDPAAIVLCRTFYERLAAGDSVDTAITEGRLALQALEPERPDWGIPVLFMRARNGRLFRPYRARRPSSTKERKERSVAELLRRDRPVVLEAPREVGAHRVLDLHVGTGLVAGRCRSFQLRPHARRRLAGTGEERVHWVLHWDDPEVSQLWVHLEHRAASEVSSVAIDNLTDYSLGARPLVALLDGHRQPPVPPGGRSEFAVHDRLTLLREDEEGRELVRLERMPVGAIPGDFPVFRTCGAAFRAPPHGPSSTSVRYLGIWIPIPLERFERSLAGIGDAVEIPWSEASVTVCLRWCAARSETVLGVRPLGVGAPSGRDLETTDRWPIVRL